MNASLVETHFEAGPIIVCFLTKSVPFIFSSVQLTCLWNVQYKFFKDSSIQLVVELSYP